MKKVLFALPALAFTLFLAFCHKAEVQEATPTANHNTGVTERGTCKISVLSDNVHAVTFCGTNTNIQTCNVTCVSTYAYGVEVLNPNGTDGFVVTSPITLAVTTASPGGSWISIVTSAGSTPYVYIPAGTCRSITVADDCSVTFL
jgi:hypothetical protein